MGPESADAMDTEASFVILSKEGCVWCDRARALLDSSKKPYECRYLQSAADLVPALKGFGHEVSAKTFPQILHGSTYVGTYDQLVDYLEEPLLSPDIGTRRFTPFPVVYHDLWAMYKKAVASFWTVEEVSMTQDVNDWKTLTPDERHFIKHVLAFFAGADGIVMENLAVNFGAEVKIPEARSFYSYQAFNESVHNETYALLIDALVDDAAERDAVFRAIETMPAVRRKAQWAMKWLNPTRRFAERLVAFACVEGILFSGSFCSIFWLKQRGLMPGLGLSNQFISRDEGLHQAFATALYSHLRSKLTEDEIQSIVGEAVDVERAFIVDAIPCRLVGMNSDLMVQYIQFVADRLLVDLGCAPRYKSSNPFTWMELISLSAKDNFFEKFSSEYRKAGVMDRPEDQVFGLDEDF